MRDGESTDRYGDADIAAVAAVFADPGRARVLVALADGRSLPASMLAAEAGLSAPAASAHLRRLRTAGFVAVEPSGRHRYYRLAGPHVAQVMEALATLAPGQQVRSLRQGTRARALRSARTCYDHLAGRLGVAVTAGLVDRGALARTDGATGTARRPVDPLSSQLPDHPYALGPAAAPVLAGLGVDLPALRAQRASRPLLRFCLDWTEQRHHVAGRLGAALLTALVAGGAVERRPGRRDVRLTAGGARLLAATLDVSDSAGDDGSRG